MKAYTTPLTVPIHNTGLRAKDLRITSHAGYVSSSPRSLGYGISPTSGGGGGYGVGGLTYAAAAAMIAAGGAAVRQESPEDFMPPPPEEPTTHYKIDYTAKK